MAPIRPFSSTVSIASTHSSAPALSLAASTVLPPSKSTLLASSKLELRIRVKVAASGDEDEQEMGSGVLLGSALLREVRNWLAKHRDSVNVDGVGDVCLDSDGAAVVVPLHSYTRSAMCSRLSMSRKLPPGAITTAPSGLESVDLLLTFTPPPSDSSQPSSLSTADTHALMSTLASTSTLHFTISPLISRALVKIAQKLVVAFPLCFNSRWIERLFNDLTSHSAIASSLSNILDGLTHGSESDTKAVLLKMTLSTHLQLNYTAFAPVPTPSVSNAPSETAALSSALLLLAGSTSKVDGWKSTTAPSTLTGVLVSKASNKTLETQGNAELDAEDEGLIEFATEVDDQEEEEEDDGGSSLLYYEDEGGALGSEADFEELDQESAIGLASPTRSGDAEGASEGFGRKEDEEDEEDDEWVFGGMDDEAAGEGEDVLMVSDEELAADS